MGAPSVPPVIPQPFANNNPALRNDIPNTTSTPGEASWDQGWPSDTMQPVVAGGVPPFGQDFNGVEYVLSGHDFYVQAGALYPWQSAVAAAIGGYGLGAVLVSATDPNTIWRNVINNNSSNPDATDGSAVGWVSLDSYGFAVVNTLAATPVTLTNIQATKKVVVLGGTLTANVTVYFPANVLQEWLVINNTTGSSFTVVVRVAGNVGVGVTVPQGGPANPLSVYSDGTNMYPAVAPLGVPISQGPDPLTLAERDNLGQLTTTLFIGTSAFENPATQPFNGFIGLGPDQGTFRKYRTTDVESILSLGAIGGSVTAGQVPLAAVIQYAANILANAALTGTPTTPTATANTSTTQVASTAFANPGAILGNPGAFRLPSGHLVQYGVCNPNGGTVGVGLPIAYSSTGSFIVLTTGLSHPTTSNAVVSGVQSISVTNSGGQSFWATIGF